MASKPVKKSSADPNDASSQYVRLDKLNSAENRAETKMLNRRESTINVLSEQIGKSVQNVADFKFRNKQEILLQMISILDPELASQDLDAQFRYSQSVLDLLEHQKTLLTEFQSLLKDQKATVDVLKHGHVEMQKLKYRNEFPEDNRVAENLIKFYSTRKKMLQSELTRAQGFQTLMRDSRSLSEKYVDVTFRKAPANTGTTFLRIESVAKMADGVVMTSGALNVWACGWTLTAQVKDSKLVIFFQFQNLLFLEVKAMDSLQNFEDESSGPFAGCQRDVPQLSPPLPRPSNQLQIPEMQR